MRAELYRRYAVECFQLSVSTTDRRIRSMFRVMAIGWADLVEQTERREAANNESLDHRNPMRRQTDPDFVIRPDPQARRTGRLTVRTC